MTLAHAGRLVERSAAAVGAGMVPAGLGTQVVGSILRPASLRRGGFKPSIGAINRSGSHDHFSQSCQGAIGARWPMSGRWCAPSPTARRDPGFAGLAGEADCPSAARHGASACLRPAAGPTTKSARRAFPWPAEARGAGVEVRDRTDDPDIEAAKRRWPTRCR